MHGLGLMQTTATGVSFTSGKPTCLYASELAEATKNCRRSYLTGLGWDIEQNIGAMTGRLAAYKPCDILDMNLPVCPTPKCIDQATTALIVECIATGKSSHPDFSCTLAGALAQLPFCAPLGGSVPPCLSPDQAAQRAYCISSNAQGPNKTMNGLCWAAMHDTAFWKQMLAAQVCYQAEYVPPKPPPPPPPVVVAPPPPPPVAPPPPPQTTEAGTMGMFGILALVAVAGGGYYMYRRYKK